MTDLTLPTGMGQIVLLSVIAIVTFVIDVNLYILDSTDTTDWLIDRRCTRIRYTTDFLPLQFLPRRSNPVFDLVPGDPSVVPAVGGSRLIDMQSPMLLPPYPILSRSRIFNTAPRD